MEIYVPSAYGEVIQNQIELEGDFIPEPQEPDYTLFNQYITEAGRQIEVQAEINEVIYGIDEIVGFEIEDAVVSGDEFTIGTVISAKLTLSLKTNDVIPTNAKVIIRIRLYGDEGYTEWLPLGTFYIDERTYKNGVYKFTCYDKLILTEQPFVSVLDYPNTMVNVMDEILTQLNIEADDNVVINPAYEIPYKDEDVTLREMLSYIASAHGCSVKISRDEKLKFVEFYVGPEYYNIPPSQHIKCDKLNDERVITKVKVIYNQDGEFLEVGAGTEYQTLNIYNPFVTEDILNELYAKFNGYSYTPFNMQWRSNPLLEMGDLIKIVLRDESEIESLLLTNRLMYKGGLIATSAAPCRSEQKSEFGYKGSLKKQIQKAIKQDEPYYGVTIGRANGLKIERSDGASEAIFNSDEFVMKANGEPKIYFDPILGKYVFDGVLSANVIEALESIVSPVVISEKGYIAELTVDQLETSTKVKRYLDNDTSDVNYIKIYDQYLQFITASTDGEQEEQLVDRWGRPLYWTDDTFKVTTYEETGYPVMVYVYEELVKLELSFVNDDGDYVPKITLGAGANIEGHPERGKAFIWKDIDGLRLQYIKTNDQTVDIKLGENGAIVNGSSLTNKSIRNIFVSDQMPDDEEDGEDGDVWLKYDS